MTTTPYLSTDLLTMFMSFNKCHYIRVVKVLGYPTNFLPSNTHNNLQGPSSSKISLWCWSIKDVFPPKPQSMSPLAQDTKVITTNTSEHIFFLELLQLKFCLKYFKKHTSEITST